MASDAERCLDLKSTWMEFIIKIKDIGFRMLPWRKNSDGLGNR